MAQIDQVKEYIIEHFLYGNDDDLTDDTSLIEASIVDSLGIMELITFLEKTFNIKIQNDEMLPENLDNLNNIAEFIQRKTNEAFVE